MAEHFRNRPEKRIAAWIFLIPAAAAVFIMLLLQNRQAGGNLPAASEDPGQETAAPVLQTYSLAAEEAAAFAFDDLDFHFAVITVRFSSDRPYEVTLDHFRTDEGIVLGQVDPYIRQLEQKSYYLSRMDVVNRIAGEGEQIFRLFVPYSAEKNTVTLECDLDGTDTVVVDVSEPLRDKDLLRYSGNTAGGDGRKDEISVSHAYDITGSYLFEKNGDEYEEYLLPSTTRVFVYRISVTALSGTEAVIEEARYVSGNGEILEALPAGVRSEKYDNILGRTVKESDSGYLFFYAYDPEYDPVEYTGQLEIRLGGHEDWIRIDVDLTGRNDT